MNPEENNPLSNSFATGGMIGGTDPTPNMNSMPMSDNLASAQESLTAAGMAANQNASGAMGFDQIAATDPNSTALPPVEEPLVPAAPVPGSIGSAVSVTPADPIAAPAFGVTNDQTPVSGAVPAPDVSPATAPFNPFAPNNASSAQPNSAADLSPAPTASAPQPAPAPIPMGADKPKAKAPSGLLVPLLAGFAIIALIAAVTFFILWNNEKNKVKPPVYYPQVSDENSNSSIAILSCRRNENHESPSGSGVTEVSLSYTGDKLSAYSSKLSLNFGSEDDPNAMRDANAGTVESMAALVGGTLSVTGNADGTNYTYDITSQDGTELATNDAMNVIYGTTEGEPSLALADVQAKYEAEGFVCTED